jgi:2-polyprenyl-6-methoxyphenol hydroxylase-like FAD-dependent oxidoreductase
VEGRPFATGFVAIADAWACTNPSAGRGVAVGMAHALQLRGVLREAADDPRSVVERFDAVTEERIAPWYHAQIALDRTRFEQMEALREGRDPRTPESALARECLGLFRTMTADPDLFRAVLEYAGTITPIQTILRRTDVAERMAAAAQTLRGSAPQPTPGPTRAELLAIVS